MEHQGYAHNAGAVFSLKYHLVFCPKYLKAVLGGPVKVRLQELLMVKAKELGLRCTPWKSCPIMCICLWRVLLI